MRPALDEAARLLAIRQAQIVETDGAIARIVDVGRDRGRAVSWTHGAGDEAAPAILRLGECRSLACDQCRLAVEFVCQPLHAVIGLGDGGARESVGLDDVGAGLEIAQMDVAHRLRLGQHQEIVVALELLLPVAEARTAEILLREPQILDLCAHGAIEYQDAL